MKFKGNKRPELKYEVDYRIFIEEISFFPKNDDTFKSWIYEVITEKGKGEYDLVYEEDGREIDVTLKIIPESGYMHEEYNTVIQYN